jgi:hypothetical protein
MNTVSDHTSHLRLELRKWVIEAFSKLSLESRQWDLPECDRTFPLGQRKERSHFA